MIPFGCLVGTLTVQPQIVTQLSRVIVPSPPNLSGVLLLWINGHYRMSAFVPRYTANMQRQHCEQSWETRKDSSSRSKNPELLLGYTSATSKLANPQCW